MMDPEILASIGGVGVAAVTSIVGYFSQRYIRHNASEEADRLRGMTLGAAAQPGGESLLAEAERLVEELRDNIRSEGLPPENADGIENKISELQEAIAPPSSMSGNYDREFNLLIEMYGKAIAQMNASFIMSQVFAALGAMILLFGVGLAIWNGSHGNAQLAPILTTLSGLVIDISAGLFFAQTKGARDHLERQVTQLRDDVRLGERVSRAEEIIKSVSNEQRSDALRAQVVNRLIAVEPAPSAKRTKRSSRRAKPGESPNGAPASVAEAS